MDQLESMRVFVRTAERASFSAVAREQAVRQSQVSRQIAQLERRLGVHLLTRTTRTVVLTEEGRLYLEYARRALAEADEGAAAVRGGVANLRGRLRIAASNAFFRYALFDALEPLLHAHPELRLDIVLDDQRNDLVAEGIDLAVRVGALDEPNLVARRLTELPRIVVASRAYLERAAQHLPPIVTPTALLHHACVVYSGYRERPWRFHSEAGPVTVQVSGRVAVSVGEAMRDAVMRHLGVALAPRVLFDDLLAAGTAVQLLSGFAIAPLPVHAVYPTSRRGVARVDAVLEHLLRHFGTATGVGTGVATGAATQSAD